MALLACSLIIGGCRTAACRVCLAAAAAQPGLPASVFSSIKLKLSAENNSTQMLFVSLTPPCPSFLPFLPGWNDLTTRPFRDQIHPTLAAQLTLGSGSSGNVVMSGDGFDCKQRVPIPRRFTRLQYPRFELEARACLAVHCSAGWLTGWLACLPSCTFAKGGEDRGGQRVQQRAAAGRVCRCMRTSGRILCYGRQQCDLSCRHLPARPPAMLQTFATIKVPQLTTRYSVQRDAHRYGVRSGFG